MPEIGITKKELERRDAAREVRTSDLIDVKKPKKANDEEKHPISRSVKGLEVWGIVMAILSFLSIAFGFLLLAQEVLLSSLQDSTYTGIVLIGAGLVGFIQCSLLLAGSRALGCLLTIANNTQSIADAARQS